MSARVRVPQLRGLRVRLVVAFALVAALTAATTGALTFREARTGVLQQSQDAVIKLLRTQVDRRRPGTRPPAGRGRTAAASRSTWPRADPSGSWRVLVDYGDLSATSVPGRPVRRS